MAILNQKKKILGAFERKSPRRFSKANPAFDFLGYFTVRLT